MITHYHIKTELIIAVRITDPQDTSTTSHSCHNLKTLWQRDHWALLLGNSHRQFRVEKRFLSQFLLKAGLMWPGCSGLCPVKSSSTLWTECFTSLGNPFQYLTSLTGTLCCLFLIHSKHFWCHCMVTLDKLYCVTSSPGNEKQNSD